MHDPHALIVDPVIPALAELGSAPLRDPDDPTTAVVTFRLEVIGSPEPRWFRVDADAYPNGSVVLSCHVLPIPEERRAAVDELILTRFHTAVDCPTWSRKSGDAVADVSIKLPLTKDGKAAVQDAFTRLITAITRFYTSLATTAYPPSASPSRRKREPTTIEQQVSDILDATDFS